jgi:hypothetical protein
VNASPLIAGHPKISAHELARVVLQESGQGDRDAVNPAQILAYLQLDHVSADLERELSQELRNCASPHKPIAMLSIPDRFIATDSGLTTTAARFAVLHEISHYLLHHHRHSLYLCGTQGMSARTRLIYEREANDLATQLLFQGDRFALDANSHAPSATSIRLLARTYKASAEATARHMFTLSGAACMLAILTRDTGPHSLDPDVLPSWCVTDCVPSPSFAARHFDQLSGSVPRAIAQRVADLGHDPDHSTSVTDEIDIGPDGAAQPQPATAPPGAAQPRLTTTPAAAATHPPHASTHRRLRCELFRDGDQLLAILTPPTPHRRYRRAR